MSRSNVQVAVPLQGGPTDPSHDDNLRRGIIATAVSRNVATTMIVAFLVIIGGVPIAQAIAEQVKDEDSSVLESVPSSADQRAASSVRKSPRRCVVSQGLYATAHAASLDDPGAGRKQERRMWAGGVALLQAGHHLFGWATFSRFRHHRDSRAGHARKR